MEKKPDKNTQRSRDDPKRIKLKKHKNKVYLKDRKTASGVTFWG